MASTAGRITRKRDLPSSSIAPILSADGRTVAQPEAFAFWDVDSGRKLLTLPNSSWISGERVECVEEIEDRPYIEKWNETAGDLFPSLSVSGKVYSVYYLRAGPIKYRCRQSTFPE